MHAEPHLSTRAQMSPTVATGAGGHAAGGIRGASWLTAKPKSFASHILFQPPAPAAHMFPYRAHRHRRYAPPTSRPPYLDTVTPLSVAATFAAIAPAGGEAHLHPATLAALLEGGSAAVAAGGPAACAVERLQQQVAMTPPLASFAPPKPVPRAFRNAAAAQPRPRSQSPPPPRLPWGSSVPDGAMPQAARAPDAVLLPAARDAGIADALPRRQRCRQRARQSACDTARAAGDSRVSEPGGDCSGREPRAHVATWAPHLQSQVEAASPAGWAISNRVTVANPQKGFRNRCESDWC